MKKNKMKEIILMIIVVAIISCISTRSFAGNINDIMNIPVVNATGTTNNATPNISDTTTNKNISSTIGSTNKTGNTVLPKTGVDDTVMWVVIGVSAIAAIYTYKKVRDYNV